MRVCSQGWSAVRTGSDWTRWGTLDETGETAAVGDFVVVDEESEVGVVHGGGFGRVGGVAWELDYRVRAAGVVSLPGSLGA